MIYLDILFIIFLLGFIFWLASHLYSTIFYVPYINSSHQAIEEALKFAKLEKGEILLDLGSGRGDVLVMAHKKYGAQAFGFEISPFPYLISRIHTFRNQNIKIYRQDFKKAESIVKKADVIYLYLLNPTLDKIEDWLFSNIKSNARVVLLAFKFKNHAPIKSVKTKNLGIETKIYLYQKQSLDKM